MSTSLRPLFAIALLAALPAATLPAQAASFDCRKASSFVEKAVCDSAELSALDEALSRNYQRMLASNIGDGGRKQLRADQRAWLAKRNACRTSSCVNTLYQERVDAVCDMPVISGVHALCVSTQEVLQQQPKHPVQPQ